MEAEAGVMDGPMKITAVCEMEGCRFDGGGACIRCGARLRCLCGAFVREDDKAGHYQRCDYLFSLRDQERRDIESGWG